MIEAWLVDRFSILFPRSAGAEGLQKRLTELRDEVSKALEEGVTIVILSDRGVNKDMVAIPALLATSNVHNHLVAKELVRVAAW